MKISLHSKKIMAVICAFSVAITGGLIALSVIQYKVMANESRLKEEACIADITDAFHDQGDIYMSPTEPTEKDDVTLRLRCDRYNVSKAHIQYTCDKGQSWKSVEMEYEKRDKTGYYDIWVGTIPSQSQPYFYRFAMANEKKGATTYLGVKGIRSNQIDTDEMFYVIPGFNTPEWSKGTLWYYAHLGQFFNGDTTNDILREGLLFDGTYGNDKLSMRRSTGDIKGLLEKLDYIEDLGVESVAVGPFFSSSESLGFGIDNMAAVETAFGTENDLKNLISEVHSRNMKITTDMIISYSPAYFKYFNAQRTFPQGGAYIEKDGIYSPLFKFPLWPDNFVKIWGSVGIDAANPQAADIFYKNKDSIVLRYLNNPYGLDGYRFDAEESVGNTGFDYEPEKIWTKIISSIKSVSKDVLVLSENCTGIADQYNTMFDSSWQKNGYFAMQDWFDGNKNCNDLVEVLQENLINTARPRALSSYNFLGQHDVVRLWDDPKYQRNDIKALILLQMTFLGSPVIYYGDEIGLTDGLDDNQTASPFNWDESQWDYNIYNLTKALGNLRKNYSCLKTGAICMGEIDDANQFLSFGRFDSKGSVITLCNKQGINVVKEITVSKFGVRDGKTLTDYFSGKEYKVKNGKVTVDVLPGGTVLVTGKEISGQRSEFSTDKIGGKAEIIQNGASDFEFDGKGSLGDKKDKIKFLNTGLFNSGSVSATVKSNGKAGIMIRNTLEKNSAYYGAVVSGDKVIIYSRTADGEKKATVTEASIGKACEIKLNRDKNNKFTAFYRESSDNDWKLIEGSDCVIRMNEAVKAGGFIIKGKSEINSLKCESGESCLSDDFESKELSSMFNAEKGTEYLLEDGRLTLKSQKSKISALNTNAHSSDWSFKSEIDSVKFGSEELMLSGVRAVSGEKEYVIAARTKKDGKDVFVFGKVVGGKLQINGFAEDPKPQSKVIIQLQRIGSYYTAVYSYDSENWKMIGDKLYCNYADMKTGVFALNCEATFGYACFGDSINDNLSTNTPITPTDIYTGFDRYLYDVELDKMSYVGETDSWQDIGAGYGQTNDKGRFFLYCENKCFTDFKAEATISMQSGKGDAGIIFAKADYNDKNDNCYKLSLSADGKLILSKNSEKLTDADVSIPENGLRVVIRRENGYIHVFAGEEAELLITLYDNDYKEGYVAFYTDDCAASFENYDITPLESDWIIRDVIFGTDNVMEMVGSNAAWLGGTGVTNGAVSFTVNYTAKSTANEKTDDRAGVLLGGCCERLPQYGGVFINYSYKTGMLTATLADEKLGQVKLFEPNTVNTVKLLVVFHAGKYEVYANNSEKPVLTVNSENLNGGSVALVCLAGNTHFLNTQVTDISGFKEDEIKSIINKWNSSAKASAFSTDLVTANGKKYSDDFNDYSGWNKNFYKMVGNEANWYIEDGSLRFDNATKNWNLATVTNGIYKNVSVKVRAKFNKIVSSSMFSLSICKQDVYAGSSDTGYSVRVYGDGRVYVYDAKKGEILNGYKTSISDVKEWFEVTAEINNGVLTVYLNDEKIYSEKTNSFSSGYIALQSDYSALEVDSIDINPY